MAVELTVDLVTRLYRDGVESVERITSGLSDRDWELPSCGRRSGTQTARHLVAVARWCHDWLDRAVAGDASPPFAASEMDRGIAALLETVRSKWSAAKSRRSGSASSA